MKNTGNFQEEKTEIQYPTLHEEHGDDVEAQGQQVVNDDAASVTSIMSTQVEEDIDTYMRETFSTPPDASVDPYMEDGRITRRTQYDFTMGLFKRQANNTKDLLNREYEDFEKWSTSRDTRARWVLIQANESNIEALAQAIVNASPLERITIVGLTDVLKDILQIQLKSALTSKCSKNERFRQSFREKTEKISENDVEIDVLMGPHNYIEDLNISPEALKRRFGSPFSNVEEFIVLGNDDNLAVQAVSLSSEMKNAPYLTIKDGGFNRDENSLWLLAKKRRKNLIPLLTCGAETKTILGQETGQRGYKNLSISRTFTSLINESNLKDQDKDYLKKIFIEEGVYPPGLSPDAITKMISKATSALGAAGGRSVGEALMWNMVNRPVSTARGVEFAIGSMTLDGGNDLVKEDLDKKSAYKVFFAEQLSRAIEEGHSGNTAFRHAFNGLISSYRTVEYNEEIQQEIRDGDKIRDYGLQQSNNVKTNNEKGVSWLRPLPVTFGLGLALSVVGIALAVVAMVGFPVIAPAIGLTLAGVGVAITAVSLVATYRSMRLQRQANSENLPRANRAFAVANEKNYSAKQKRTALLDRILADSKPSPDDETNTRRHDHSPDREASTTQNYNSQFDGGFDEIMSSRKAKFKEINQELSRMKAKTKLLREEGETSSIHSRLEPETPSSSHLGSTETPLTKASSPKRKKKNKPSPKHSGPVPESQSSSHLGSTGSHTKTTPSPKRKKKSKRSSNHSGAVLETQSSANLEPTKTPLAKASSPKRKKKSKRSSEDNGLVLGTQSSSHLEPTGTQTDAASSPKRKKKSKPSSNHSGAVLETQSSSHLESTGSQTRQAPPSQRKKKSKRSSNRSAAVLETESSLRLEPTGEKTEGATPEFSARLQDLYNHYEKKGSTRRREFVLDAIKQNLDEQRFKASLQKSPALDSKSKKYISSRLNRSMDDLESLSIPQSPVKMEPEGKTPRSNVSPRVSQRSKKQKRRSVHT